MKHLYKICLGLTAICIILVFGNAANGPGNSFGIGRTGAPFDNNGAFCNDCHSGGNFTPSVLIQLRNISNNPVTNYFPGSSYILHIEVSSSTGVTSNTRYGFQVVGTFGAPNYDSAGTWGMIPTIYHVVPLSNRDYVEHDDRLVSGIIDLPWTAPVAGGGAVTFYAAGNVVDFSMDPTGDNPAINSLIVPQDPLAISWLYFRGKEKSGNVLLEWATTSEINSGEFTIEKSSDGINFEAITTVNALTSSEAEHYYSFVDLIPYSNSYYRIRFDDIKGEVSIYKTIKVETKARNNVAVFVKGNELNVLCDLQQNEMSNVVMTGLDGRVVISKQIQLFAGGNAFQLEKPKQPGIYVLSVSTKSERIFSERILIEN